MPCTQPAKPRLPSPVRAFALPGLLALLGLAHPSAAQDRLVILMKDGKSQEQSLADIRKVVWQSPDLVFHLEGDRTLKVPHADVRRITFTGPAALPPRESAGRSFRLTTGPVRAGRLQVGLSLPSAGAVRLELLALDGRLVAVLAEGTLPAGSHAYAWDGRDAAGLPAEPGAYILRVATAAETSALTFPWIE